MMPATATERGAPLLEIEDLRVAVRGRTELEVLRGLSLRIWPGETLAVVGESGCGKSITSLSVMGLLPEALQQIGGQLRFAGTILPTGDNAAMRKVRGRRIGMVFQEPMSALNPVIRIGDQVAEVILEHEDISRAAAMERVVELLAQVGLPDPARLAHEYPHRLSGGQRQRVVIAMALACRPELLIADEPTTALDVTVQAQIMRLLKQLQKDLGIAILLITHNLGLVAQTADRVAVMYAGRAVEEADTITLFSAPRHPYTQGLLRATPRPGGRREGQLPLVEIPGMVPSIRQLFPGCRFEPRCTHASAVCRSIDPPSHTEGATRVQCHHPISTLEALS
ncbi:MAG: ABC transporter ATP-binding protein [Devosia sp.]|nr:ABC transporter ATP-binding protein [Devosia sp.]